MNSECFFELMNQIDDDLINRAEDRKENTGSKPWIKWGTIAACFLLVLGIGIGTPFIIAYFQGDEPAIIDNELPTDIDKILWGSLGKEDPFASSESSDVSIDGGTSWMGWAVSPTLYDSLQSADRRDFIAILVRRNDPVDFKQFVYNGKTYDDLILEQRALIVLREKLLDFLKVGESLKYGEALYTTGTPEGEKWSKDLYYETVYYYGEEFLAEYIVDGEVQFYKINEDLLSYEDEIGNLSNALVELEKVYHESYVESDCLTFVQAGACAIVKNGKLFLFAQKSELSDLKIRDKSRYILCLAGRAAYEGTEREEIDLSVNGTATAFAYEKLSFSNVEDGRRGAINGAEEVSAAMNDLIKTWQYTYDYVMVTIGCDVPISANDLYDVKYSGVFHDSDPTRTVLLIRYEDIDMEALKALSIRDDVLSIHISEPLIPIDDAQGGPSSDG